MARRRERELPRSDTRRPSELASRLDPFWKDHAAVVERYGAYLTPGQVSSSAGRNLYQSVVSGWAVAHGFTDRDGGADWHALRRAGIIAPSPTNDETCRL